MNRRYFILDKFNTWYNWHCTLTAKEIQDAEPKTNYVNIDGANGTLDLSESLAGGPVYSDRTIAASFMCSEGTHKERERLLREIRRALHGRKIQIIEPDDPEHYFLGRVKIKEHKNHQAYLEFTIEATCDPWRYAVNETVRKVEVKDSTVVFVVNNNGSKTLTARLIGAYTAKSTILTCHGISWDLRGTGMNTIFPKLYPGVNVFELSGYGGIELAYREADL